MPWPVAISTGCWSGSPPEVLVANINRFLNIMRARRRWRGYFGFSVAPDTNINAASDAEIIYINGLPFRRSTTATNRASSDIGVVGWGGGEYQFPVAERWRLRSGININHREYKGSRFDQTFISGYVGPRWLINRNTEISLLASASQRWWGGSSFNYDYGARLEVERRVFAGLRLSGRALWSDRKYQQNPGLEWAAHGVFPRRELRALPDRAGEHPRGLFAAGFPSAALETAPGTGREWGRTWRCRGVLPWAPAPSSGGRITRAGGVRSSRIILPPERTRPASCRPRS